MTVAIPLIVMGLAGCRAEGELLRHSTVTAPETPAGVGASLHPAPAGAGWDYAGRLRVAVIPGLGDAISSALEFPRSTTPQRAREVSEQNGLSPRLGRVLLDLLVRAEAVRLMARAGHVPRGPLEPGTRWVMRSEPFYAAEVEAMERITVAGRRFLTSRVRITGEGLGPDDRILLWYRGPRLLRLSGHVETVSETGRLIVDQTEELAASLKPLPVPLPQP
jgi:hypothetical protein